MTRLRDKRKRIIKNYRLSHHVNENYLKYIMLQLLVPLLPRGFSDILMLSCKNCKKGTSVSMAHL